MADKSLSTIASELWQGFGNNPRNVESFDAIANVFPPAMLYRGAKTLANTDYGAIKDFLLGKYQISPTPKQDLQRAGQAITDLVFGAMDVAPALPLVKPAMKAVAPELARGSARMLESMTEKYGLPSLQMSVVPPEGNLNFTTRLDEQIKGPEVQTVYDLLKQVQGKPGVTKEGLKQIAQRYPDTSARISKEEFKANIPASRYEKVDLKRGADDAMEHYMNQAEEDVRFEQVIESVGVPNHLAEDIADLQRGYIEFNDLSPEAQKFVKRTYGVDKGMDSSDIQEALETIHGEIRRDLEYQRAYELMENAQFNGGDYAYTDQQRLVVGNEPHDYFEFGVTHPDQQSYYPHYDSDNAPEGLVGHIRGSYSATEPLLLEGNVRTRPNSYVPEEFQADVQKHGVAQEGPLHQVHGTLFKAAMQDAAERGADYVYLPTSRAIGRVRNSPGGEYSTIYDDSVVKEGLNQLTQIPGVEIIETPRQFPWSYRWTKDAEKDAFNSLGIPKKQHDFAAAFVSHPTAGRSRVEALINKKPSTGSTQGDIFRDLGVPDEIKEDLSIVTFYGGRYDLRPEVSQWLNEKGLTPDEFKSMYSKLESEHHTFSTDTDGSHGKAFLEWADKNIADNPAEGISKEMQFEQMVKEIQNKRNKEIGQAAENPDEFPYYVIKMNPETREHLLTGPGQASPGLGDVKVERQRPTKAPESHPFIGYMTKDGKMERFNETQAKEADYHHSNLVKDLDAYDSDDALKFVRNNSENVYTIRGNAAVAPHSTESKKQLSTLAKQLVDSGADPSAPFQIEHMSLPEAEAPYQGKTIGTLKDWIEGTHGFAAGGLVASDYDDEHIDQLSDQLMQGKYGLRVTGEPKEEGALGEIRMPDGMTDMTEYSINPQGRGEMPSIVEGMHPADLNYLREYAARADQGEDAGDFPAGVEAIAKRSAAKRKAEGKSPFWNRKEDKGFEKGGAVNKTKAEIQRIADKYFKVNPSFAKRVPDIYGDLEENVRIKPSKYGMNVTSMPGFHILGVDPSIIRTERMLPSDVAVTTTSRNPFSKPVQEMVFNVSRGDEALPTLVHESSHAWDATNRPWLKKKNFSEKEANQVAQRYMSAAPKLRDAGDVYMDYTFDEQPEENEVVAKLRAYESILPAGAKLFQTRIGKRVFPTDESKAWWLSRTQPSMSDQDYLEWATKQAKEGKGYAEGGLVYNDEEINNLADQLLGA